jgi:hypothetical protein
MQHHPKFSAGYGQQCRQASPKNESARKCAGMLIGSHARKLAKLSMQPLIDKSFRDID